jgi:hypothetical protein
VRTLGEESTLVRLLDLDREIVQAAGWLTAEDLFYVREAEAEAEAERAL